MRDGALVKNLITVSERSNVNVSNLVFGHIKFGLYKALSMDSKGIYFDEKPYLRRGIYNPHSDRVIVCFVDYSDVFSAGSDIRTGLPEDLKLDTMKLEKDSVIADISLGNIKESFEIKLISCEPGTIYPREEEISDPVTGEKINIALFQTEDKAGEILFKIIKKLEFMDKMDDYLKLYDQIKSESIDGLKVQKSLEFQLIKNRLNDKAELKKRNERLITYASNKYLKNKWKSYAKNNGIKGLGWEDLFNSVMDFAQPVIKAEINDQVFVDSWMPELGRYLS